MVVVPTEEVEEVATQSLESCNCESTKHSTWSLEERKNRLLLGKTTKCFSSLPPVKAPWTILEATDTAGEEQCYKMEARMAPMVGIIQTAMETFSEEGRDQDLTWEH